MCGATSYRAVISRDEVGAMRASGLFQCSGCSVVFADPKAWRDGGKDEMPRAPLVQIRRPVAGLIAAGTGGPGPRLHGLAPAGSAAPD
jgi:hypothetical protein